MSCYSIHPFCRTQYLFYIYGKKEGWLTDGWTLEVDVIYDPNHHIPLILTDDTDYLNTAHLWTSLEIQCHLIGAIIIITEYNFMTNNNRSLYTLSAGSGTFLYSNSMLFSLNYHHHHYHLIIWLICWKQVKIYNPFWSLLVKPDNGWRLYFISLMREMNEISIYNAFALYTRSHVHLFIVKTLLFAPSITWLTLFQHDLLVSGLVGHRVNQRKSNNIFFLLININFYNKVTSIFIYKNRHWWKLSWIETYFSSNHINAATLIIKYETT